MTYIDPDFRRVYAGMGAQVVHLALPPRDLIRTICGKRFYAAEPPSGVEVTCATCRRLGEKWSRRG